MEGLERPDKRFVVAVQWHPEDQVTRYPEQLRLISEFAAAFAAATFDEFDQYQFGWAMEANR